MTWFSASWRGLLIVVYFVTATVWLPNKILRLDSIATASSLVQDLLVLAVWGGALVTGMWLLRFSQRKGHI